MIKFWLSVCIVIAAQVSFPSLAAEGHVVGKDLAKGVASARANKNAELQMAPQIETATIRAARIEDLRSKAPTAKNITENALAEIDEGINTIDRLLRNPNRRLINGWIEGNLPRFLQFGARADAQAAFDKIKAQAANSLIANSLIQTGTMPKFDAELIRIRARLYLARLNAVDYYNVEYGKVAAGNPSLRLNVPPIADRYVSAKDLPRTSTKVDYNNPLLRGMKR